jgi:hypothetical protein
VLGTAASAQAKCAVHVRGWLLVIAYDRQILLGRPVGRIAEEFLFFSYFNGDVAERESAALLFVGVRR